MMDEQMMQDPAAEPVQAPEAQQPDGGNPDQMIGYIPEEYPAKDKTYLAAAKAVILNDQTAGMIRRLLGQGNDPAQAIATFIGMTVDKLETKLGPLTDDEHDRVCLVIAGWMASTLQAMGMPGMEDAGARQDFMGRVLTQLDGMTQGQGAPPPDAQQGAPMGQFAGGA